MARLLLLSLSDVSRDPRVARQVDFLADEHEVVVAAYGSPPHSDVDFIPLVEPGREELLRAGFRIATNAELRLLRRFETAYWRDRRFPVWSRQLQPMQPDLVLANDAIALPIAFEVAHGAPVVFDAHEYAPTEHDELLRWRLLIRPLVRHICRRYLPRVAAMMAVSRGIADLYAREAEVQPAVVTNAPPYSSLSPRPAGDRVRLIHFGGADRLRRLETMIELMAYLDERFSLDLLLVGNQRYVAKLKRLARDDPRIRFLDPVPMQELVRHANEADIGVFVQGGDNPQRRYALPNKFFEYIQARLAVAIGPSPEMAEIVERYACGIVSPTFEPRDLAALLNGLDSEELSRLKQGSDAAARELNAEANAPIVREVVQRALAQK
jgi:glycosyltransferase involved in cell wall biosynthesis